MTGLHVLAFLNHAEDQMDFEPLWIGILVLAVTSLVIVLAIDIFG